MEILTAPRRGLVQYRQALIPLGIGWCIGFLTFAKGISAAFSSAETVTTWLFIGLICGTFPALLRQAGKEGHPLCGWVSMLVCAAVSLSALYFVHHISDLQVEPHWGWYNLCGALLGIGIIVPGLSTSPLLMALGLYQPMLEGLSNLDLPVLLSCVPGLLLTVLLLARLVNWLFHRHYALAFHGITGIVAASALSIIPLQYTGGTERILSAAAAVFGAFLALLFSHLEEKTAS